MLHVHYVSCPHVPLKHTSNSDFHVQYKDLAIYMVVDNAKTTCPTKDSNVICFTTLFLLEPIQA